VDDRYIGVRFPTGGKISFFSPQLPDRFQDSPILLCKGYWKVVRLLDQDAGRNGGSCGIITPVGAMMLPIISSRSLAVVYTLTLHFYIQFVSTHILHRESA
jgi:hypothetical protein